MYGQEAADGWQVPERTAREAMRCEQLLRQSRLALARAQRALARSDELLARSPERFKHPFQD